MSEELIENPEYTNAPFELSAFPKPPNMRFHRFKTIPPMSMNDPSFEQWVIENSIPPYIKVQRADPT